MDLLHPPRGLQRLAAPCCAMDFYHLLHAGFHCAFARYLLSPFDSPLTVPAALVIVVALDN
ncbi:hypothetical protein LR021_05835 [Candidatus Bipolaricaulota bacterium]|nr:hypothetical protein [Candidatus Bipolaricaulota bacterium]